MKQIEVQILKKNYYLKCADGEESRLLDAVQQVDAAMTRIYEEGKMRGPTDRIAVLAALHLALDLLDVRQQLRALETESAASVDAQSQTDADATEAAEPATPADADAQPTAEEDAATPAAPDTDTDAVADANVEAAEATDAAAVDAEAQAAQPAAEPPNKDQDQLRALIARIDQALQKIA